MVYPPYVGTASYYTCSAGSGACGTCNSNSTNQVCYPDLNSHPPNYAAACGPIPVHSCGDTFYVANYCDCTDPIGAFLTVVDHGPGVACTVDIPQCDLCTCTGTGYYRYMDLPQGTFVELDGDLDEGLIIVGWSN